MNVGDRVQVSATATSGFAGQQGMVVESSPDTIQQHGIIEPLVVIERHVGGGYSHRRVLDMADVLGLRCHDLIVHNTGSGPGGHNIFTPKRARRHHSYLLVFVRPRSSATCTPEVLDAARARLAELLADEDGAA